MNFVLFWCYESPVLFSVLVVPEVETRRPIKRGHRSRGGAGEPRYEELTRAPWGTVRGTSGRRVEPVLGPWVDWGNGVDPVLLLFLVAERRGMHVSLSIRARCGTARDHYRV